MSALAGLWNLGGKPDAAESCARMLAAQEIYGPHDGGKWSDGSLALGRRLYRTLPEDAFDRQPLQGAGERLVLVADVRLDNREELGASLDLAPATVGVVHRILAGIFKTAVRDRRIVASPCEGTKLPKIHRP